MYKSEYTKSDNTDQGTTQGSTVEFHNMLLRNIERKSFRIAFLKRETCDSSMESAKKSIDCHIKYKSCPRVTGSILVLFCVIEEKH